MTPSTLSPAERLGRIVALAMALTLGALWAGIVVGIAVKTVRMINGW